jgi:hypothetical protein
MLLSAELGHSKKGCYYCGAAVFSTGFIPEGTNETSIVLLAKIDNPAELKDYRHIGLSNVIYKVVSKCLVNRPRPFLEGIISKNQSAFVP